MSLPYNVSKKTMIDAINNPVHVGYNSLGLIASGNIISQIRPDVFDFRLQVGKIVTAGPNDEADYTDYRYWVRLEQNDITSSQYLPTDKLDIEDVTDSTGTIPIITAYNLSDYVGGTHTISENTIISYLPVWFDAVNDTSGTPTPIVRYIIMAGGGSSPIGEYQGQVMMNVTDNQEGSSFIFFHEALT